MHLLNSNINSDTSLKLQNLSLYKFGLSALSSSGLAFLLLALGASHATAQLTIQSTGTISGTLRFPFGPTVNNRTTRIDTDTNGTYYRNIGTKNNPNLVPVYSSKFVQIKTNSDGSIKSFVDFYGLQFISSNGLITSPVFSGGKLKPYQYQGRPNSQFTVDFQASVQDELSLQRAFYEGIVTDPKTGQQYQGVFEINGQGPRYSDRNGGDSPTVFDFKTDYAPGGAKPTPALSSYAMKNTPLVRLTIKVPAGMQPIIPAGGTPVAPPVVTPGTPSQTPVAPPVVTPGTPSQTPVAPPVITPGTPNQTPVAAPVDSGSLISNSSSSPTISTPTSPAPQPGMEFSSGKVAINSDSAIRQITSEQTACLQDTINCRPRNESKLIGPRSRVLVR